MKRTITISLILLCLTSCRSVIIWDGLHLIGICIVAMLPIFIGGAYLVGNKPTKKPINKHFTPQDFLDFYNEHITFTGELTIKDVENWIERKNKLK